MRQVYLDTVIQRVFENTGNDPDLREDFIQRILSDRIREKEVIPAEFFPVSSRVVDVEEGVIYPTEPYLSVLAIDKADKESVKALYLKEDIPFAIPENYSSEYMTEDVIRSLGRKLGCYHFTEDPLSKNIFVYTDQAKVCMFYYSLYRDDKGREVIPEFAQSYLESYGTMKASEVLLNKGLRGKAPVQIPQLRYSLNELRGKVTREFLSLQREINLLTEKTMIKPVNQTRHATF